MRTILSVFVIVFFAITGVYAFNDWNEPCTSGVCHYGPLTCLPKSLPTEFQWTDLDSSQGTSSGTLKIVRKYSISHVVIILTYIPLASGVHIRPSRISHLPQAGTCLNAKKTNWNKLSVLSVSHNLRLAPTSSHIADRKVK
jgi:hypothetical protein